MLIIKKQLQYLGFHFILLTSLETVKYFQIQLTECFITYPEFVDRLLFNILYFMVRLILGQIKCQQRFVTQYNYCMFVENCNKEKYSKQVLEHNHT